MKLNKKTFVMGLCSLMMMCTSCDTAMAVLAGMAEGMNGYGMTSGYVPTVYSSAYSGSAATSYTSYSSSSSSSSSTCRRCGGTGACKTCGGTGKVYDYGPSSVISKEKYTHKCGVCNGTGKCGACH